MVIKGTFALPAAQQALVGLTDLDGANLMHQYLAGQSHASHCARTTRRHRRPHTARTLAAPRHPNAC